jgi:hypothetical protein
MNWKQRKVRNWLRLLKKYFGAQFKTKGCLSRKTALTMVFKLCQSAQRKWRRLDGPHQLAEVIKGVTFKDGVKLTERAA